MIIAEVSRDSVKEFGYNRPVIGAMRRSKGERSFGHGLVRIIHGEG
jgi:hypothetical protein